VVFAVEWALICWVVPGATWGGGQRNGTTRPVYPQTTPGDMACRFRFNEQVHLPATLYKVTKPPEPEPGGALACFSTSLP
jgi:hypothetical protein